MTESTNTTTDLIKRMLAATPAELITKHEAYHTVLLSAAKVPARPYAVTDGRRIAINGDLRRALENAGL